MNRKTAQTIVDMLKPGLVTVTLLPLTTENITHVSVSTNREAFAPIGEFDTAIIGDKFCRQLTSYLQITVIFHHEQIRKEYQP